MRGARYSKSVQKEFSVALNERVQAYFKDHGTGHNADLSMIMRSVLLFGSYTAIYLLILLGGVTQLPLLFLLWGLLGLGQALIGMGIMHDAVHGAYTKNRLAWQLLQIPIIAIGVEHRIWRIEHNILHHTYPNVEGIDQDIHPRFVFRFTEHQPRRWFHAFQHIYATFIYGLLIIEWITVKDFLKVIKYRRMGYIKSRADAASLASTILLKKLIFYFIFLYLPLQLLPFAPYIIISMFITMLVVAGIVMTIIFQLAHVVPDCETENGPAGLAARNWHVYQLQTTCDFAHGNKLLSHLIGGLNYQIEHHLFPHVCHIHYPALSIIVKQTAAEYGVAYHYEETFAGAVSGHYRQLRELGREGGV